MNTMTHTLTSQSFTLSNGNTADTVRVSIIYNHPDHTATVEAWPEMYSRDEAEKQELLASAHFAAKENWDTIEDFKKRMESEAAVLGMDTLREWSRPLLREPDTRGDW